MADLKRFGDYIRDLRGDRSQDDLALSVGLTGSGWSLIENASREPKISTLVKMAKALKVAPATLISVYEGEDAATVNNPQQVIASLIEFMKHLPPEIKSRALMQPEGEKDVVDLLNHLPGNLVLQALLSKPPKEVFSNLLRVKGKDKMRELIREVMEMYPE